MNRLKELRDLHGFTQEYMAHCVGRSRPTYTRWEAGENEPDIESIGKLADIFNVTADYLLGRTDTTAPQNANKSLPTIEEALEHQGVTDAKHVNTIKELVEMMRKVENNAEIADEISIKGLNENRRV